jgi:hypothetical protein
LRVFFEALQDLEIEFVVSAAERLVRGTWFPKVGEWRNAAITVADERRQAQRAFLRKLPAPLCDACADTGWVRDARNCVSRCVCSEQRRLEILGRRPWPALPMEAADSHVVDGPLTHERTADCARPAAPSPPRRTPVRKLSEPVRRKTVESKTESEVRS